MSNKQKPGEPVAWVRPYQLEYLQASWGGEIPPYKDAIPLYLKSPQPDRDREVLESIRIYGSDTLSGRVDGPEDAEWYRGAVVEMTRRAFLGGPEDE